MASCYVKNCPSLGEPDYTFSWRIRGPLTEGGPPDRIVPGYTNSGVKACAVHAAQLAEVCSALFRDSTREPTP